MIWLCKNTNIIISIPKFFKINFYVVEIHNIVSHEIQVWGE
jgi:hypothetical protein